MSDEKFMKLALKLARKGMGKVSPNPMVGAVITDEKGKILSVGYHKQYGGPHAEREALSKLEFKAQGAIMYVNLEPCCHWGKTPPCTEAIIASGIKKVVIGTEDVNPLVAKKGIKILKEAGIEVKIDVLKDECLELNKAYFKWIKTHLPYVILKWAQSIDGRIATKKGLSQWISHSGALKYAHKLRAEADAVLVGRGTVQKDDPMLTVRLVKGRNPLRVVLDSSLKLPLNRKVFSPSASTLVFTLSQDERKINLLREKGVEVVVLKNEKEKVPLLEVLKILGERGVANLLVEGGAKIITAFLDENLADEIQVIISPLILGKGIEAVGDLGYIRIDEAIKIKNLKIKKLKEDLIIEGRL